MRKCISLSSIVLTATALALSSCAETAEGEEGAETIEVRYSTHVPEAADESVIARWFFERADELAPNYKIDMKGFYSESLVTAAETMTGLKGGRVDAALMAPAYTPSEMPLSQLPGVPFLASNGDQAARALNDLYAQNELFRNEYDENGLVPVFWNTTHNVAMGLKEPISSVEELDGLKIRAIGLSANALEARGVVPIALSLGETYEALQTGAVDGVSGVQLTTATTALSMQEVAPHWLDTGFGQYAAAMINFSQASWEELPDEVKDAFQQAAIDALDYSAEYYKDAAAAACEAVEEAAGSVTRLPDEEIGGWEEDLSDDLVGKWVSDTTAAGVSEQEAQTLLQEYEVLLEQYEDDSAPDPLATCAQ